MECGECTLCCTIFPVKWLNKPVYTDCTHCELKKGCKIHKIKPDECTDFNCSYAQMKKANISLRPDKCGIVFEKISDKIFFGSLHPDYPVTETGKNQITAFSRQGFSVILFSPKEKDPLIFVGDKHISKEEVVEEYNITMNVKKLWQ